MKKDNLHINKSGFKVPEGYFENFEAKLSKKLTAEKDGNQLVDAQLQSGFKVPEEYFNTLSDKLSQKLNPKEQKVVSIFTRRTILYVSGIAAMIAILISVSINRDTELNFNDIEIADIHIYFSEGNIELSDIEIASLLGDDINYSETFEEELINEETMLDYLSDEDIADEIIFVE